MKNDGNVRAGRGPARHLLCLFADPAATERKLEEFRAAREAAAEAQSKAAAEVKRLRKRIAGLDAREAALLAREQAVEAKLAHIRAILTDPAPRL